MGTALALGWELPANLLDLLPEYQLLVNTRPRPRVKLFDALDHFEIPHIRSRHKDSMRQLAIDGGPFDQYSAHAMLHYCTSDVRELISLLRVMAPEVDLERALDRGQYLKICALMERRGLPIDECTVGRSRATLPTCLGTR